MPGDPTRAGVPFILLTGNLDLETREAAGKAGATAFPNKPFRPTALLHLIDRLVDYSLLAAR